MVPEKLSEAQLRLLLDTALDVVILADAAGVFRWVSASVERVLGWTPADMVGRSAADFVHPGELAGVLAARDRIVEGVTGVDQFRVRRGDGTYRWVSGRSTELVDAHGSPNGRMVVLRDLGDLMADREALEADREALQATLDSLIDPHVVLEAVRDERHRIVDFVFREANRVALPRDNRRGARLIGARTGEILSEHAARVLVAGCRQVLDTGVPIVVDNYEYADVLTNGPRHRYDVRAIPLDEAVSFTWREVTDRHRARLEFADSEQRYRRLAENASDIVYETTPDGLFTWVSPSVEQTLGWTPEELLGAPTFLLVSDDERARTAAWREELYSGVTIESREVRIRAKDGELHWMSLRAQPVHDDEGVIRAAVVALRHVCTEVVERRAAATLAQVSAILARAEDEHELLRDVCQAAVSEGGYLFAWYGRPLDDAGRTVQVIARGGAYADYLTGVTVSWGPGPLGRGPSGTALRTGATQVLDDSETAVDFAPWRLRAKEHGFRSSASVPVSVEGQINGALTVYAAEPYAFGERAIALLDNLAGELGYGLERIRDRARLDRALGSAVDLLAATVESRDPYTAGHQSQVAMLAVAIGAELGLDHRHIEGLHYAANVHDLGKVAVPIAILNKHARLSPDEYAVVRRHPTVGADIARRFDWPWPIADVIEQHHEQWDGSGYPLGLRGAEIVREARIVAVADAFEAIAAARPYREARGYDEARRVIEEERGTHFDPEVVDAFLRVLDAGFRFPRLQHT